MQLLFIAHCRMINWAIKPNAAPDASVSFIAFSVVKDPDRGEDCRFISFRIIFKRFKVIVASNSLGINSVIAVDFF